MKVRAFWASVLIMKMIERVKKMILCIFATDDDSGPQKL